MNNPMISPSPVMSAVIFPVSPGMAGPGSAAWEKRVAPYRKGVVRLHALIPGVGVQPEAVVKKNPRLLTYATGLEDRSMERETVANIRGWLSAYGPLYQRIVLVKTGPMMPLWTKAGKGMKLDKVRLIGVSRAGTIDASVHRRIAAVLF